MRKIWACEILFGVLALSGALHSSPAFGTERSVVPEADGAAIDVAICLDTSNSMDAVLDAARLNLWEIVNDLATAQPTPRLRVALLSYGNSANERSAGWVGMETPLTEDLDLVSQRLFALTTSTGADEYVGRVLQTALERLDWTESGEALKLVFIGGNEAADKDTLVDVFDLSREAMGRGVAINMIYFRAAGHIDATTWEEVARLGDGRFAAIDGRDDRLIVPTPIDSELAELGSQMNETYIPLGEAGREAHQNQAAQDQNALSLDLTAAAARAEAKASPLYTCAWDLVDALENGRMTLPKVDRSELPELLQQMTLEEREAYVEDMIYRRGELRLRIAELSQKRRQYVAEQTEAQGLDESRSFDSVVRRAVREKAEEKGFYFPES